MKGFFQYIAPFAPDYSGAVSALYDAGGILVVCDASGCSGNVCGYDEPRFYSGKTPLFSAAIRELDTIFGRDDRLEQKIIAAVEGRSYEFIALIGTPVPALIGTDLDAIARRVEAATGIPAFGVSTTGSADYDVGERKAWEALARRFMPHDVQPASERNITLIIGLTPLETVGPFCLPEDIAELCGNERAALFGGPESVRILQNPGRIREIVACSPAGSAAAAPLADRLGISIRADFPLTSALLHAEKEALEGKGRLLILHQQYAANRLRRRISEHYSGEITVGSFFMMESTVMLPGDLRFSGEDELIDAAAGFDVILADPFYFRALGGFRGRLIPLPHTAVSGDYYDEKV